MQRRVEFYFTEVDGSKIREQGLLARRTGGPSDGLERSFQDLKDAYARYQETTTAVHEFKWLLTLIELATTWLDINLHSERGRGADQIRMERDVRCLNTLCQRELEHVGYRVKHEQDQFLYLTVSGRAAKRLTAADRKFIDRYGLTEAELVAIKVYTAGDYEYINPTFADDASWLEAKIQKLARPTTQGDVTVPAQWQHRRFAHLANVPASESEMAAIREEAREHGEMALRGLQKLPDWHGTVYRGMTLPASEVSKQYPANTTIRLPSFTSTTVRKDVAERFASGTAEKDHVALVFEMAVTTGKEVGNLSEVRSEGEVLLLPGMSFTVREVLTPAREDDPYRISLQQTP